MKHLMLLCLLLSTSCSRVTEREFYKAPAGTPFDIIDKRQTEFIKTNDGNVRIIEKDSRDVIADGKKGKANLDGMMAIDEPTLNYYRKLHEMFGREYLKMQAQIRLEK